MTTTTTTKTMDVAVLILNYALTTEDNRIIRAIRYDVSDESIAAINSHPAVELFVRMQLHAVITMRTGETLKVHPGDYIVEESWNKVHVVTGEKFVEDMDTSVLLFQKRWTEDNLHEWDMEATDMGENQGELAEWVEEHIRTTATVDTIQQMLDNPDKYISQACKALGWYAVPQSGGLCVSIWRYRLGIDD